MTSRLVTVAPATPVTDLLPIFEKGMVAIVVEDGRFLGLITRIDVLNYLRRRAP
jgi:cystathionine beta-synthase